MNNTQEQIKTSIDNLSRLTNLERKIKQPMDHLTHEEKTKHILSLNAEQDALTEEILECLQKNKSELLDEGEGG